MLDNIHRYTEKNIEGLLTEELGSSYAEYRLLWKRASGGEILPFPVHLDFEVNDRCNKRCAMCPRNEKTHGNVNYTINTGAVLSLEHYQEIINEGSEKGLASVNLGAFAEPLLHKDVLKMVEYSHKKGIVDSRLITNGLLLNCFKEEIFESGLVHLFVSIDAHSEETYSQIRGKGFELVQENLLAVLAEKQKRKSVLPIIRVSFLDMGINNREKEDFIEYWRDKVDFIDVQVFDNFNVDINQKCDLKQNKKWNCTSPWSRLAVLANGNVLPCCNFFGMNVPVGNINESTLEDIWNSKALSEIRKGISEDSCKNCSICQRTV